VAALHDRADQEAGLAATRAAFQNARPGDDAEGLADCAAMPTGKAVRPADAFKISRARHVIGKLPLELRERLRESQVVALVGATGESGVWVI
jgi:hypothetical protein